MNGIVAFCEYGRLLLCNWRFGLPSILHWVRGYHLNYLLCEYTRDITGLLLLDFRSSVRFKADGSISIFLRLVWCQDK